VRWVALLVNGVIARLGWCGLRDAWQESFIEAARQIFEPCVRMVENAANFPEEAERS
jgi:hypothetical protein